MRVRLKLFAYLRETLGFNEKDIEVDEGTSVGDLWDGLKDKMPGNRSFSILFAVNGEYVERERELKEGDEVALIPPVSGG